MKQIFTIKETYFLIGLVVLTVLYTIFINLVYVTNYSLFSKLYSKSTDYNELKKQLNDHPLYSYFQLLLNFLYLIASVYFFVNNKIKTMLFGLVCFFMFTKGISSMIKYYILHTHETKLGDLMLKYIHNIAVFDNFVALLVSIYFIKFIFFNN
jgi:hypothetical protein